MSVEFGLGPLTPQTGISPGPARRWAEGTPPLQGSPAVLRWQDKPWWKEGYRSFLEIALPPRVARDPEGMTVSPSSHRCCHYFGSLFRHLLQT
jgi:hypothetical protein